MMFFTSSITDVTGSSYTTIALTNDAGAAPQFIRKMRVLNASDYDALCRINEGRDILVPARTMLTIFDRDDGTLVSANLQAKPLVSSETAKLFVLGVCDGSS